MCWIKISIYCLNRPKIRRLHRLLIFVWAYSMERRPPAVTVVINYMLTSMMLYVMLYLFHNNYYTQPAKIESSQYNYPSLSIQL